MNMDVRPAGLDDAPAIAALSGMFGYEPDVDAHTERLAQLLSRPEHAVWVAEHEGRVAGWLHAMLRLSLESRSYIEIAGLVVDQGLRSRGIGAALLRAAEQWAKERGHHEMRVRSNVLRSRAHAFYAREGYAETKQQRVLAKRL
ncbi:GNAT family N-acetyltransferase [Solimonas soli]|uniref:GNAT family N-acetyltransferase n=1 Tax=Solimonas soli TaxID=413479 RepID=UPI00048951C7|nr:GNAT family N-acetyltransferase [Solimonas soli]